MLINSKPNEIETLVLGYMQERGAKIIWKTSQHHKKEISQEVNNGLQSLTSQEEKVTYLQHLIVNEKEEIQKVHFYKSSAIRLLGENGGSNAIPLTSDKEYFLLGTATEI